MNCPRRLLVRLSLGVLTAVLLGVSCARTATPPPTPTPNYPVLETQVAAKLGATLTAKAPTSTQTPPPTLTVVPTSTPSPRPQATPSKEPSPIGVGPVLAYVRTGQDRSANIVLYDTIQKNDTVLTHFTEPLSMSDVAWSKDGRWLIFVSAHDFIHSRNNERNAFIIRSDGTELRMLTGDYANPDKATGPYTTLQGQVVGAKGACVVCAQGTGKPVTAEANGVFELAGVPVSARWIRAVCQDGGMTYQGDRDLLALGETFSSVTMTVEAKGQGWSQASLSRDGQTIAGTTYTWTLGRDEKRQYCVEGILQDLKGNTLGKLAQPTDTTLFGLDWSPKENKILGALTGAKSTWLWQWDAQGASLGALVEIPNQEQVIFSASNPVWSPDASQVAFGLRNWNWWGQSKYKTEIMLISAAGKDLRPLVKTDWGIDASYPSWTGEGARLYYQVAQTSASSDYGSQINGDIWSIPAKADAAAVPLTEGGTSALPAMSPPLSPTP